MGENRASGVPEMILTLRENGQRRPVFESTVASFVVTMNRSELLGPDTAKWLATLPIDRPTPMHDTALSMLRTGDLTNAALQEWGADRITAGAILKDLVDNGIAVRHGGRRYAKYLFDPSYVEAVPEPRLIRDSRTSSTSHVPSDVRSILMRTVRPLQRTLWQCRGSPGKPYSHSSGSSSMPATQQRPVRRGAQNVVTAGSGLQAVRRDRA